MSAFQEAGTQKQYFLYVGTYGEGIYGYRFDASEAKLEPLGLVGKVVNPSFVIADREYRHIYAVSELEGKVNGAVAAFAIDRKTGGLQFLNTVSSGGEAPCHLAVDKSGKMLVVANYTTGGVSAYPIQHDGRIGEMSSLMTAQGSSVNTKRQQGPHAHETVFSADNRLLYVPDLGLDHVRIYLVDPGHANLAPNDPPFVQGEPGFGPRHIAFSPNGKFAYVVNELKPAIAVFSREPANGNLRPVQTVSTVPPGFTGESAPAEIEIDHAGKFVYASNRGPGTIAVFSIDPGNGTLRQIQVAETGGTFPRGFQIDPSGRFLFAGDQKSNQFTIFGIDQTSGRIALTGQIVHVPSPVSFLFVPVQ